MSTDRLVRVEKVLQQKDIAFVVAHFMEPGDIVRLTRTCKRLAKILKFPEIERLLLRKKIAVLERVTVRPNINLQTLNHPFFAFQIARIWPKFRMNAPHLLPMPKKMTKPTQKEQTPPKTVEKADLVTPTEVVRDAEEYDEELSVLCSSLQMHRQALQHREMHMRLAPIALGEHYRPPFDPEAIIPFYKRFKKTSQKIRNYIRTHWL